MSVLLVEDEVALCEAITAYLEDEEISVISAGSGEDAVAAVRAGVRPLVCILDMRLPGMDGNATALALHQLLPDLKFLIHTGSSDYRLPAALRQLGLTDAMVFSKPQTDLGELAAAIKRMIDE